MKKKLCYLHGGNESQFDCEDERHSRWDTI